MSRPVFRIAPSPNGELHLGHALSALLNFRMSKSVDGRLLLRIEDIDAARCTPEFEAGIYRDLEWLGVEWEKPVRRQSEHMAEYRILLERMIRDELVYPAFMSRGEIRAFITEAESRGRAWPRDPDGAPLYPGVDKALSVRERQRRIAQGEPFSWRLDMEAAADGVGTLGWIEFADEAMSSSTVVEARPHLWGDVVVARKDVPTSYHLAVVADDALQDVSHVVRGLDLKAATGVHRLLQHCLGLPAPSYFHHRLVLGPDGRKLSKSLRDTGLKTLREGGARASDVAAMVGL